MDKDEQIRAKALEISVLFVGPVPGLAANPDIDPYLRLAESVGKYIRQGMPTDSKK
jgi:hypothetical protein